MKHLTLIGFLLTTPIHADTYFMILNDKHYQGYIKENNSLESPSFIDTTHFSSINTDPIFEDVRANDGNFLKDSDDVLEGIYLASDSGGLPFPMSFSVTLTEKLTISSFKIGSKNNGQGTRLRDFSIEYWDGNNWIHSANFNFQPTITSGVGLIGFERQEFSLPESVTTDRIRVSALSTDDYYAGGRVLMWGLSFN